MDKQKDREKHMYRQQVKKNNHIDRKNVETGGHK